MKGYIASICVSAVIVSVADILSPAAISVNLTVARAD